MQQLDLLYFIFIFEGNACQYGRCYQAFGAHTEELRLQSWGVGNAKERLHGCRFENKIWKQICWAWHKI